MLVDDGLILHFEILEIDIAVLQDELGISVGETSDDGIFTLQSVACLGCCSLAPVIMINEGTYGNLTTEKIKKVIKDYKLKENGTVGL